MRWFEKPEVLDYLVACYAGVDVESHRVKRQFIWETEDGDVVIGNSRAFADHVAKKFGLPLTKTSWMTVHEALRALGEVAQLHTARTRFPGRKFRNQEPETRVLKRRGDKRKTDR